MNRDELDTQELMTAKTGFTVPLVRGPIQSLGVLPYRCVRGHKEGRDVGRGDRGVVIDVNHWIISHERCKVRWGGKTQANASGVY